MILAFQNRNPDTWSIIISEFSRRSGTGDLPEDVNCPVVHTAPVIHRGKLWKLIQRFIQPGFIGLVPVFLNLLEKAGCEIERNQ